MVEHVRNVYAAYTQHIRNTKGTRMVEEIDSGEIDRSGECKIGEEKRKGEGEKEKVPLTQGTPTQT